MIEISITGDFSRIEVALLRAVGSDVRKKAIATALSRCVAAARTEVMAKLPQVFDRPTPYTVRSVLYAPATPERLEASVYISDDSNRGLSPRRYLLPEIEGGPRSNKGSEGQFMRRGLLGSGQQTVPGQGAPLDRFGNFPGSQMVLLLSRVGAFGEQGYRANATQKTRDRLARQGKALTKSGFDFFIKRGKGGKPLGVYKITKAGQRAARDASGKLIRGTAVRASITPMVVFVNRKPLYHPRFEFHTMVADAIRKRWSDEMRRALLERVGE